MGIEASLEPNCTCTACRQQPQLHLTPVDLVRRSLDQPRIDQAINPTAYPALIKHQPVCELLLRYAVDPM